MDQPPEPDEIQRIWSITDRPESGSTLGFTPPIEYTGTERRNLYVLTPTRRVNGVRPRLHAEWQEDMSFRKLLDISVVGSPEFDRTLDVTSVMGTPHRYHGVWGPETAVTFDIRLNGIGMIAGGPGPLFDLLETPTQIRFRLYEPETGCELRGTIEANSQSKNLEEVTVDTWGTECRE